jgi:hypothetical protein
VDDKPVLLAVEDADQGLAVPPAAREESPLIDMHDQDVVA